MYIYISIDLFKIYYLIFILKIKINDHNVGNLNITGKNESKDNNESKESCGMYLYYTISIIIY